MNAIMNPQGDNDEPGRRTKLEDEVLEILSRTDRPLSANERLQGWFRGVRHSITRRGRSTGIGSILRRLGQGSWLLASLVTAIAALIVNDSSPFFARVLAILCVAFFAIPIVTRWRRPDQPETKRWRGQDIDFRDRPPDALDDFRRRFRRPPRR